MIYLEYRSSSSFDDFIHYLNFKIFQDNTIFNMISNGLYNASDIIIETYMSQIQVHDYYQYNIIGTDRLFSKKEFEETLLGYLSDTSDSEMADCVVEYISNDVIMNIFAVEYLDGNYDILQHLIDTEGGVKTYLLNNNITKSLVTTLIDNYIYNVVNGVLVNSLSSYFEEKSIAEMITRARSLRYVYVNTVEYEGEYLSSWFLIIKEGLDAGD